MDRRRLRHFELDVPGVTRSISAASASRMSRTTWAWPTPRRQNSCALRASDLMIAQASSTAAAIAATAAAGPLCNPTARELPTPRCRGGSPAVRSCVAPFTTCVPSSIGGKHNLPAVHKSDGGSPGRRAVLPAPYVRLGERVLEVLARLSLRPTAYLTASLVAHL